ncbi:hypothetical protein E4U34_005210 [Claviceps purpurea]|nr:hypothetical protein E4U11_003088 [Claviceps purpurea]KAG6199840.1 hypothetical protein E4U10_003936 [Claviceps purpurea]KAG6227759.1 hypothetical protein E4U34_005210 [Claviceps purpurea]KAG6277827.1 hypothetical protein E4U48_000872 [Claviceps purpurea]KAG6305646.1 hypothetical protein E4U45_008551 [Claviceps purpurea]
MGHAEERIASEQAASLNNQQSQVGSPTPDRRSTGSTYSRSRSSDDGICSHCSSTINSRSQNSRTSQPTSPRLLSRTPSDKGEEFADERLYTPPRWTSPGLASSIPYSRSGGSSISPLRRELSHSTPPEGVDAVTSRAARHDIARRLTQLARRLACDEPNSTNDLMLGNQLEQLEKVVWASPSPEPKRHQYQPSFESPLRSDAGSSFGSPVSSLFKSRFSDLSASLQREREAEKQLEDDEPPPKRGMSDKQAKKVIAEMGKLNDELSAVVNNLKARQEESEHIQGLLIERAERAAQRIIFLQNRITYLEEELQENDGELQHLRICLKAVEIQMPPHPDKELQRCIATFKTEYQALKRKRAHRANIASVMGYHAQSFPSPTRSGR